jgi:hypothetical protein
MICLHANQKQGRHFRQDLGVTLQLLQQARFFLGQEAQAPVPLGGTAAALDHPAPRRECGLPFLSFALEAISMSASQPLEDGLSLLLCHHRESLVGVK